MEEELPHNKFENLKVFVTGVSSGIGYAVAKSYLNMGSTVFGIDIDEDISLKGKFNDRLFFYTCDVSNYENVKKIIDKILIDFDSIDVLINCAGIIDFKSIENSSIDFWKKVIDVNLTGSFITCKNIVPQMKKRRRGSVINVSSRAAKYGGVDETAYCASKFGIEGLSRSLFEECKPYNIVVNSITPGTPIHTSMSEKTYSPEKRKIWKDPHLITPAFLHLGIQDINGINNQYVDAWKLSKKVKNEYIIS